MKDVFTSDCLDIYNICILVYFALNEELKASVHALSLRLKTPGEEGL